MDTTLLTSADADGLSVFHIADAVRLRIFQRNQCDNQVALCLCSECLVLGGDVFKQGRIVEFNLVTSLFEGNAKALLSLNGSRLVVRINLNDVIRTLALVFQYLNRLGSIVRSNHTIAHFALQQQRCRCVASVAQCYEIAIRRHTVSTSCPGVSTSDGRVIQTLYVIHEVYLLQRVTQRKSHCGTGRRYMFERGSGRKTCCSLQLLHQLPSIKGIEEVDIARTTVNHFDR